MALLSVLALILSACNLSRRGAETAEDEGPVKYGDESSLEDDEQAAQGGGGGQTQQGGGAGDGTGGGGSQTGSGGAAAGGGTGGSGGSGGGGAQAATFRDLGATGSAARAMLQANSFKEIVIEIDYVQGRAPSEKAKNYVADALRQITGKRITFSGGSTIPARGGGTSTDRIRELSQSRNISSGSPRVALWIGYLNGQMEGGANALGVAVGATVIGMFPDQWRGGVLNVNPDDVESTVLLHEVGHLLAMTEIGYISPRNHRDCAHGHHNRFQDSIMYYAAETTGVSGLLGGGPLYFDSNDLADLADIRAGRVKADTTGRGSCA